MMFSDEPWRKTKLADWLEECEEFNNRYITRPMPRGRSAAMWDEHAQDMVTKIRQLTYQVQQLTEVMHWAQSMLTALNVGDVKSESPLHLKLREILIQYRDGGTR